MITWIFILLFILSQSTAGTPSFDQIKQSWRPSEAWLLDRHGEPLHELRVDMQVRRLAWMTLGEISPVVTKTLVQGEDKRFLSHHGIDWVALAGATRDYIRHDSLRGASTLSMQLAAMLDDDLRSGSGRRSLPKKFAQMLAAARLENKLSKEQILEAYLNLAYFRGELQGIAAASGFLFGKHASGLNEQEAALLVALLQAPGATAQRVSTRACAITPADDCAQLQTLAVNTLNKTATRTMPVALAPHLARQLLVRPGSKVQTTLDAGIQRMTLDALTGQLLALHNRNVRDGAAMVVENSTGAVLAYVAAGPYSTAREVDGIRAVRQAGSTLKPFLYGLALERQYLTAASVLQDLPVNLETKTGLYIPQNYDRDFKGPVSVRTALAGSLNVPAVRTLVITGVEDFRDRLRDVGYRGLVEDGEYYGYSLALGSAEVSLLEQVTAYRTLARGGLFNELHFIKSDSADIKKSDTQRVMPAEAAFIISDILSDPAGRAITFGLSSPLTTRSWSAVKTGTSKDMRDNWCIGYSDRYTVGVWTGNYEGDSMHDVSGISGAAPVWQEIMNSLHENSPSQAPSSPVGVVTGTLDFEPAIEPARKEWFITGTETSHVILAGPQVPRGRITSPAHGTIIALDPDIPENHQYVPVQAAGGQAGDILVLNEAPIGAATSSHLWQPQAGTHILKLINVEGRELDQIKFAVRPLN